MNPTIMDVSPRQAMPTTDLELEKKESVAQMMWTGFIILFFLIQAVLWTVAIGLTHNDPRNGIVENYDQKAMNWNAEQQLRNQSAHLAWNWQLELGPAPEYGRQRTLMLQLSNQQGQPISEAQIKLVGFHCSRSGVQQHPVFTATDVPGRYQAMLDFTKAGRWRFEVDIEAGHDHFVGVRELDLH